MRHAGIGPGIGTGIGPGIARALAGQGNPVVTGDPVRESALRKPLRMKARSDQAVRARVRMQGIGQRPPRVIVSPVQRAAVEKPIHRQPARTSGPC